MRPNAILASIGVIALMQLWPATVNARDGSDATGNPPTGAPVTTATAPMDENADADLDADLEAEFADIEDEYAAKAGIGDPLKIWNKPWFYFNDKVYFWGLKPVSKGYGWIVPEWGRIRIDNFFENVQYPRRFFNTLFQGSLKAPASETARFVTNSTVGIGGLFDPATSWLKLKKHDEDFDQTLGVWGMGKCGYITWPILGPSSTRGTLGLAVDYAMSPTSYVPGVAPLLNVINKNSLDLNPYESIVDSALDPYVAVRDAYVQNRNKKAAEHPRDAYVKSAPAEE